jgi:tetratricopeptide (TPR) repeat protein
MKLYVILLLLLIHSAISDNIAFVKKAGIEDVKKVCEALTRTEANSRVNIRDPDVRYTDDDGKKNSLYYMCPNQFELNRYSYSGQCVKSLGNVGNVIFYSSAKSPTPVFEQKIFKTVDGLMAEKVELNCSYGTNEHELDIITKLMGYALISESLHEDIGEGKFLLPLWSFYNGPKYLTTYFMLKLIYQGANVFTIGRLFDIHYPDFKFCDIQLPVYIHSSITYIYANFLFEIGRFDKALQCFEQVMDFENGDVNITELEQYKQILMVHEPSDLRSLYYEINSANAKLKSQLLPKFITYVEGSPAIRDKLLIIFDETEKDISLTSEFALLKAQLMMKDNQYDNAIQYLQEIVPKASEFDNCQYSYLLASAYLEKDLEKDLEKAKEILPNSEKCQDHQKLQILRCDIHRRQFEYLVANDCFGNIKLDQPSNLIIYEYLNFIGMKGIQLLRSILHECTDCTLSYENFVLAGILGDSRKVISGKAYFENGLSYFPENKSLMFFKSLLYDKFDENIALSLDNMQKLFYYSYKDNMNIFNNSRWRS